MSSRHFTVDDRMIILKDIIDNRSIRSIAKELDVQPSSVSRELEAHRVLDQPNRYVHKPSECARVSKAPWVCHGCKRFSACRNLKYRYSPQQAQRMYEEELHSCRRKARTGSAGIDHLNHILVPLVKENRQTIGHIYAAHGEELGISRSTCYRYIDQHLLNINNSDLPKRVRYSKRAKYRHNVNAGIDSHHCREGRDYVAFLAYIKADPYAHIAEMDTVIGKKGTGQKVLLTLLLRKSNFMLAFLRDENSSSSVIECLDAIQTKIRYAHFKTHFNVTLTDNGPEFKDADHIEHGSHGAQRCHLFYCDSRASQQKGRIEKNHEYIRKLIPQGTSFNDLSQDDINLMMSHINSVKRDSLGGKSPFEMLTRSELKDMKKLGLSPIEPDEVILSSKLFK